MAKYNFYAIAIGRDPATGESVTNKICDTWKECKTYIKNVDGARYKGFLTVPEAQSWIKKVLDEIASGRHSAGPAQKKPVRSSTVDFERICGELGINPESVVNMLKAVFCKAYEAQNKSDGNGVPFE